MLGNTAVVGRRVWLGYNQLSVRDGLLTCWMTQNGVSSDGILGRTVYFQMLHVPDVIVLAHLSVPCSPREVLLATFPHHVDERQRVKVGATVGSKTLGGRGEGEI
jgi:hypothetical protein